MMQPIDARLRAFVAQRGAARRLAERAGVAASTVSRILQRGSDHARVHVLRRIEDAIAQLEAERAGKVEQGLGNGSATVGAGEGAER